jgi:hypothetical protein
LEFGCAGIAFTNVPATPLFPTVGMRTEGEKVVANFGTEPFQFNIAWYTNVCIDARGGE